MDREEAIEIIRKNMPSDKSLPVYEALQTLIPELTESDDERTRKFICSIIDNLEPKDFVGVKKMNVLAWLEKQKEQKSVKRPKFKIGDIVKFKGYGDEPADSTPLKIIGYDNELYLFDNGTTDLFCEQDLYELVEQKEQKQEWSEEDEKIYQTVFKHFNSYEKYSCSNGVKKEHVLSWLKTLKPSWKPSKEQMDVLFNAGNGNYLNGTHMQILRNLYNDLKKIK